jgi:undecaprenyl-diphosphatase
MERRTAVPEAEGREGSPVDRPFFMAIEASQGIDSIRGSSTPLYQGVLENRLDFWGMERRTAVPEAEGREGSPVDHPFFFATVRSFGHFFGDFVTLIQALILGIVQGIAEFFPVSSSAHLRLCKKLFGIADGEHLLYFDLLCHAGTLLALVIYLRRDIAKVLTSPREVGLYAIALLPLVPAYFLLKPVRIALSDGSYLGIFLIFTGALLWAAARKRERLCLSAVGDSASPQPPQKWGNVLWIGVMQAMALVPGISRSGSTIAAARFCGWSWIDAARFSFLLAVPTIVGGECFETMKLLKGSSESLGALPMSCYAAGFAASFGVGLFAVRAVFWIYERGKVAPFAAYCFGAGVLALAIFHG